MLELRKIDRNNVWQVARLKVKRAQADYVASNIESILEAFATREAGGIAAPFALYDGVALVGFVMIGYGDLPGEENPAISAGNYCLWRLMIDERWQERGYGTQALALILDEARDVGLAQVEITCDPDNHASRRVIEKNGGVFVESFVNPRYGAEPHLRFLIRLD